MEPRNEFNKEIEDFINQNPNSNHSQLIKLIRKKYRGKMDDYSRIDTISGNLGFRIFTEEIEIFKITRYQPKIKINPENKLLFDPKTITFMTDNSAPTDLNGSYKVLAKESIYLLGRVRDIEKLI